MRPQTPRRLLLFALPQVASVLLPLWLTVEVWSAYDGTVTRRMGIMAVLVTAQTILIATSIIYFARRQRPTGDDE